MAIGLETRIWARAVFACVLAIALLVPTIDTCVCATDLGAPQVASSQANKPAASSHDDEAAKGSPCHYCHCSQPVGVTRLERVALGTAVSDANEGWASPDALHPAPSSTLLRPPRA